MLNNAALANYYQDGGIWEEAQELMHAVKPQWGFRNTLASLYRRDALAGFFSGESRRVVDRLFEKSNELNNDQDFELSALIARAWILYSDGSASEALDVLEPFEGLTLSKLEKWSISLSPHNIFELMLIRATLKKALGKPYMKEVVCFNTLAETKPETLLRAVFTDQIGPHIIHDEFSQLYSRLQSNFLFSPELARILKSLGRKIIEKKESPSQGMNSWAD